ncbi:MMPL family transporter [Haloferula rosea]|uniref:MMPL family transporter n=1 Tax=Haloferula rosea TaxID=490093 RepID=A0A934R5N0_9BACT|nr:MMPL family transporter [Haloferula rosea]MBK1825749.1 MMPL family transporter [Haloferula rosea]
MRKWWQLGVLLILVLVSAWGLGRIRFDTDPLAVLPDQLPEVKGLKAFQEGFSRDEELIILLEGEEDLPVRAEELTQLLLDAEVSESVRWQPRWREDPEGLAELFAWLWLNAEPEEVEALRARLDGEELEATLEDALERVATSMDGGSMMLSAHDPLGLLDHPALVQFFSAAEEAGDGFGNPDGTAHLLLVDAPGPLPGYQEAEAWLQRIRQVTEPWAREHDIKVSFTGDPAFEAEIGGAMQRDMSSTIGITSALIGLLFLLMQRRVPLLIGLTLVLGLVFVTAMGLAGWIYGELSIMAAGFAAILIGLAVDYGVLICQEGKVAGHDVGSIRGATARSIVAAAVTTAAVFLALNLSGLPGIAQLGTVVALGVLAGAAFMLVIYVPWVSRCGAGREQVGHKRAPIPARRGAVLITVGLAVGGSLVLVFGGLPGVAFDRSLLRPKNSAAMAGFERIQEVFPAWGDPALKLLIEGGQGMGERLDALEARLQSLQAERPDFEIRYQLPRGWWPSTEHLQGNRAAIEALAADAPRLLGAADEFGFSNEGLALDRSILEALPEVVDLPIGTLPASPAAAEFLRGVISSSETEPALLGSIEVEGLDDLGAEGFEPLRALSGEGVQLAGWALLKPAVLPLVKRDMTHVFLPMVGLMLVMLTLVFRNIRDVATAMLAMGLSGVLLLAAMKVLGLQWNFLNIAATPLLLGTGLDYMIHILLALRRTGGDIKAVWNGTGKAVLFCGCSTAIGFGSLAFASIDALASLGKVAVVGILISMLVSVILVPGVRARRRPLAG